MGGKWRIRLRRTGWQHCAATLAHAIADLHGASTTLEDNKPGVKVVVSFPVIGTQTANEAASAVEVDYLLVMFFVIMT